ncbi:MAG: hypothetical protein KBS57_05645 [Alistipes sp.]|nr:hypothetical protein [Candidatus Minthomonas equi]
MEELLYRSVLAENAARIETMKRKAFSIHEKGGQVYGPGLPYGFHLQQVADIVSRYGYLVCIAEQDVLPVIFGAYFHDSLEDTCHSYNDIRRFALYDVGMTESQSVMAAEIVYALTDEKGRNRKERQNERYYQCLCRTPYAPFVKMADRLANISFSFTGSEDSTNLRMREIYRKEWPEFISKLRFETDDSTLTIPSEMIEMVEKFFC